MNIVVTGIIIFVIVFLLLSWIGRTSSKTISKGVRNLIIIVSLLIAIVLAVGGRILFSLPLFFLALSALKIKGLTAFQIWQIWRLLNYLRTTGRYSYFGQNNNHTRPTSDLSIDEAYKILNLDSKKKYKKEDVLKSYKKIMKKIHPDVSPELSRLAAIVNEAKEIVLKDLT